MSLIPQKEGKAKGKRYILILMGLFGASLLYALLNLLHHLGRIDLRVPNFDKTFAWIRR